MQGRDVAIVIGAAVLIVLVLGLLGPGLIGIVCPMCAGMMGWGSFGFAPFWWVLMLLFWAVIIGGVVLLVVWLVRQVRPGATAPSTTHALDILQERYARGEITRDEYERIRSDLLGDRGAR